MTGKVGDRISIDAAKKGGPRQGEILEVPEAAARGAAGSPPHAAHARVMLGPNNLICTSNTDAAPKASSRSIPGRASP